MGNVTKKEVSPEVTEIAARLEKIEMFQQEKPSALLKIAQGLQLKRFAKGEFLLRQGDEADSLYIIASGMISFTAFDPEAKSDGSGPENAVRNLGELGHGNTFGEFGLVHNVRRTANAIAASDEVVVLVLDRATFDRVKNTKYMKTISQRVQDVCGMLMLEGLKKLPFLSGIPHETLKQLGHMFKFEVVPEATKVCTEGEYGNRFYIVFNGELVVTMKDELGFDVELTRLYDGSTFGDTSLLTNTPRTATITSLTSCELFSLERNDLLAFLEEYENVRNQMMDKMVSFTNANLINSSVPIFKNLSVQSQQLLGVVSHMQQFPVGHVIIKEGADFPRDIFVIVSGCVNIFVNKKKVRTLRKGYFGEVSLFSDGANSATVKVAGNQPCNCLVIPQKSFSAIMGRDIAVYSEIAIKVFGKNVKLKYILRHPAGRESFMNYCKKEFAQENVDFWLEVTELEDLEKRKILKQVLKALKVDVNKVLERKRKMLIDKAERIYDNYVKPGAKNEVNIAAAVRSSITAKMEAGDYTNTMFEEAKLEVFKLVEADNFTRYKESNEFKAFLESMEIYENVDIDDAGSKI